MCSRGSSVELSYAATDNALRTVETPAVTASATRGQRERERVQGPGLRGHGHDKALVRHGIRRGTLHVITKADTLKVTDAATGTALTSAVLEKGETLSLKVAAQYLLRDVYMDSSAVTYSVSGSIGTVTARRGVHGHGQPRSPRARSRSRPRD